MARDELRLGDEATDAHAKMAAIFASLERLQTGILKAEAVLGRMRANLGDFRKPLDPRDDEGTRP